jgi:hypothetical protein
VRIADSRYKKTQKSIPQIMIKTTLFSLAEKQSYPAKAGLFEKLLLFFHQDRELGVQLFEQLN